MSQHIPSFHDGRLTGIQLDQGKAVLSLNTCDGDCYRLQLNGVRYLRMDDFSEGNIINVLDVIGGETDEQRCRALLAILAPAPHPTSDTVFHEKHDAFLVNCLDQLRRGEALLVSIEPSYGADFVAYCEKIELTLSAN